MHSRCMTDDIKAWLKRTNRDREWLGSQLGVTKRTVDNWLSAGQSIPEAKAALIQRLMDDDAAQEAKRRQQIAPINQLFSVEVDLPRFRRYSAAALARQQTLEQWAVTSLDEMAADLTAAIAALTPQPQAPEAQPEATDPAKQAPAAKQPKATKPKGSATA